MDSDATRSGRARPMAPDDRRAHIIEATVPLLAEHGWAVTSRQIAEAAGVAEGTIFRAFGDKDSIVRAALEHVLDQTDSVRDIDALDPALDAVGLIGQIVRVLQRRLRRVFRTLGGLGVARPPAPSGETQTPFGRAAEARSAHVRRQNAALLDAVTRRLADHRAELRLSPERAAQHLRLTVFAASHPFVNDGPAWSADELIDVIVHAVCTDRARSGSVAARGKDPE